MKMFSFSRMALAVVAGVIVSLGAGCHSPQSSASAPIPPNWYDSYYNRDGLFIPDAAATAGVRAD